MALTNFIAAIDLGTSHIVGMVGVRNKDGILSVIAHEREESANFIRRGNIHNVGEAARQIARIIKKMENKLPGSRIGKVYVGVGGQSIRSIEHVVPKSLGAEGIVTQEILDELYKECKSYQPDMLDVLAIASPVYYLNGEKEANPIGISCNKIEARYKLIVARPVLRQNIKKSVADAKIELADIFVSPLALAEAVLKDAEKDLGCTLVNFGAGVTSVATYKYGELLNLCVIPLGGQLITKDVSTCLNIVESEAERIKKAYGNAMLDEEDTTTFQVNTADGNGFRIIESVELNKVVEARAQEILENVYARLETPEFKDTLGAGAVITGGAADLNGLTDAIHERLQTDVRYAYINKGLVEKSSQSMMTPDNITCVGLLLKADQNCSAYIPKEPVVEVDVKLSNASGETPKEEKPEVEKELQKTEEAPPVKKPERTNIFAKVKKVADGFADVLFKDEDYKKPND